MLIHFSELSHFHYYNAKLFLMLQWSVILHCYTAMSFSLFDTVLSHSTLLQRADR
jgi:hypothetical protein